MGCIVQQYVREKLHVSEREKKQKKKNMVHVLCVSVCVCLESCWCLNVCECLSVPEQAGAAHSGPTNTYSSLSSSLSLFVSDTSSFFPRIGDFFSPSLLLFQVSAATIVPNRLEISEWRERQDETVPPRPLLSPSSSVQWTDRHCRWFSPLPPPPPDLGAPAAALPWDSSDSAKQREERVN